MKPNQRAALEEVRRHVEESGIREIILFGSVARSRNGPDSDLAFLVLVPRPFPRRWWHGLTDMAFEVNPKYGTNLSTLVAEREAWENWPYSVLPIHTEIAGEGIPL